MSTLKNIFSLEGQVAIVTGAGKGIGESIALALAEAGADVAVASRTASDIQNTAAAIEKRGRRAIAIPTDVRVSDQVHNLVAEAVNKFGKIDILVNNAGGSFGVSLMDMSENAWDAVIRENLKSVFLCSQIAGKKMMEQKSGSIINLTSIMGLRSNTGNAAYGAAKAGIINFTMSLARDLAKYNIRVNAIAPGFIGTKGFNAYVPPELISDLERNIPARRIGRPEEMGGIAVFLASAASSYITGQTIVADGGVTLAIKAELPGVE